MKSSNQKALNHFPYLTTNIKNIYCDSLQKYSGITQLDGKNIRLQNESKELYYVLI